MSTLKEEDLHRLAASVEFIGHRFLEGHHRSPKAGAGLEFESLQPYTPGDELRGLDWKRLAATDRAFVQRKHPERKNHWMLIPDRSPSMYFAQKWDFVQLLLGSLMIIFKRWGDSWTLWPDGACRFEDGLQSLMSGAQIEPSFQSSFLPSQLGTHPHETLYVYVSDFMFESTGIAVRNDHSMALQILDEREIEFPYRETYEFRDLESDAKILLPAAEVRDSYQSELRSHQLEWQAKFRSPQFFMCLEAQPTKVLDGLELFFRKIEGS